MKTIQYWRQGVLLILIAALFIFWRFAYPFVLAYHEENQLFLWDYQFLYEHLCFPGGFVSYLAEMMVQFYNNFNFGAFLIAILMGSISWTSWKISCRDLGHDTGIFIIHLLPVLSLWILMGDYKVNTTFVMACLSALLMMLWLPRNKWVHVAYLFFVATAGYYLIGMAAMITVLYLSIRLAPKFKSIWYPVAAGILALGTMLGMMYISALALMYPLAQICRGINYYMYPAEYNYIMYVQLILILAISLSGCWQNHIFTPEKKTKWGIQIVHESIFGICGLMVAFIGIKINYQDPFIDDMEYELLERTQNWDGIIEKASKKQPETKMAMFAYQLALFKTGMTRNIDLMNFMYANHKLVNNQIASLLSDIYFQMGMVNLSQRFAFEALELTPDHNMSGRLLKRLAETNMINDQYQVAGKYLSILQKTIFYREWANETMVMVNNPKLINESPAYGPLHRNLGY